MLANMNLLNFAVNSPKNCEYFHLGHPSSSPIYFQCTANACQRLPMPHKWLAIVANGANGLRIISNKHCDCLTNVINACECLQMGLPKLQTYL